MTTEELQALLQDHLNRYPLMQPQDVVKLLYQNEFGPGHLVADPEACLERLKDEFSKTVPDERIPLIESIGNGLIRINLANMEESDLSLEDVTRFFVKSASEVTGDRGTFLKTLDSLRACYGIVIV